ncbi:DUF5825 family protein [Alicyclobacillus shizuokensis]|uniref:DUF5825 family protein n=1 Tax=Alicyclobacillus shizuokensis TaxID=392014 RepID=UPI003571005F
MQQTKRTCTFDPDQLPTLASLEELLKKGLESIELDLSFNRRDPLGTLNTIRFLRDAMSLGIRISWYLITDGALDLQAIYHIQPPRSINGGKQEIQEWRRMYHYGAFYWRKGPGFVLVKDTRNPDASAQFVIDERELLDAFELCLVPVKTGLVTKRITDLVNEGIILEFCGHYLTLPYRVLSWPVPYDSI